MRHTASIATSLGVLATCGALLGCGSGSTPPSTSADAQVATHVRASSPAPGSGPTRSGPAGLTPDSASAATGDIPDNQVFLTFASRAARWSIRYPEGWARRERGTSVTFKDKNNLIRVSVFRGRLTSLAAAMHELGGAPIRSGAAHIGLPAGPAVHLVYSTKSAPNAVTGRRVVLLVDRYELARGGRRAVIDLGTPQGVDNVDAYRLIAQSFRWR
jgi:hypothetical protein